MTKPNKSELTEKLERWAKLEKQRLTVEAQRDKDLDPHVARFTRATESINSTAKLKLDEINARLAELAKEIESPMLAGVNVETGVIALPQVSAKVGRQTAVAIVTLKEGARVINPEQYFEHTPPAKRTKQFWETVTIPIAKATAFIGDVLVNRMASKAKKPTFEIKLSE